MKYCYFKDTEEALEYGMYPNDQMIAKLIKSVEYFQTMIKIKKNCADILFPENLNEAMKYATYYQLCVEALSVSLPGVALKLSS